VPAAHDHVVVEAAAAIWLYLRFARAV